MLRQVAKELIQRANSDIVGGWSTNHVKAMELLATEIYSHLGRGNPETSVALSKLVADRLHKFAIDIRTGGWSTQNLAYFEKTSMELYAHVGRNQ